MKKFCITFLSFVIIMMICFSSTPKQEYLRIHIRASSNLEADQAVKLLVRDEIVSYLTPIVSDLPSKAEAMEAVEMNLEEIEAISNQVLLKEGFSYTARATLKREAFPTRVYDNLVLESGVYDALIVELGTGEGDNWWCVVYPSICFPKAKKAYRSIIWETIQKYIGGMK